MARADFLNILYAKNKTPEEFHWDSLWIPSMYNYLTPYDIAALNKIIMSLKLSSKVDQKYQMVDDIMESRGFKRLAAGTNRLVYRHLEDTRFVAKIPFVRAAINDNLMEFKCQNYLRPFVTKAFEVSPCGTVGFFEKVDAITSSNEFISVADDVFWLLTNHIIGKYVLEDIGTLAFMNYGIRRGFGPVLLDYPYVFPLDSSKLHCALPVIHGQKYPLCDGEIDYDIGFNYLVCTRCGKRYNARELEENIKNQLVVMKGANSMLRVALYKNGEVYSVSSESEVITPPKNVETVKPTRLKVRLEKLTNEEEPPKEEVKQQTLSTDTPNFDVDKMAESENPALAVAQYLSSLNHDTAPVQKKNVDIYRDDEDNKPKPDMGKSNGGFKLDTSTGDTKDILNDY